MKIARSGGNWFRKRLLYYKSEILYYKSERRRDMKLNIKIDTNVTEPEALIITPKMNEEVSRIADFIEKLNGMTTVISGTKDGRWSVSA